MPVEDVFLDLGARHGVHGRDRARRGQGGARRWRSPTSRRRTVVTGVEMFRKLLNQGQAGDNIGTPLRRRQAPGSRARPGECKQGSVEPHTKF